MDAILLDAGGVMIFPSPELLLPPLHAAGVQPTVADLERAHYRAMADCDQPGREPPGGQWWREYLQDFVTACGVPAAGAAAVAGDIAGLTDGFSWTHVGRGVVDALRGIAALGLPLGVVSNSTGEVEQALRQLAVCYAPGDGAGAAGRGIEVGVVIDSAVVGVSKPDPGIFALALDALGMPAADRSTWCTWGTACATTWWARSMPASGPSIWTRTAIALPRTVTSTSAAWTKSSSWLPPASLARPPATGGAGSGQRPQ